MDRKNINSSENKCFLFQLWPYQVILRIALVSITMVLLTWRLLDFGDEFLNSEIHMSTPAGILTGATALLLQTAIIMSLALIAWWIFRWSYAAQSQDTINGWAICPCEWRTFRRSDGQTWEVYGVRIVTKSPRYIVTITPIITLTGLWGKKLVGKLLNYMVARGGIEPPTRGFSKVTINF